MGARILAVEDTPHKEQIELPCARLKLPFTTPGTPLAGRPVGMTALVPPHVPVVLARVERQEEVQHPLQPRQFKVEKIHELEILSDHLHMIHAGTALATGADEKDPFHASHHARRIPGYPEPGLLESGRQDEPQQA